MANPLVAGGDGFAARGERKKMRSFGILMVNAVVIEN
jgi:hypothetical protein